MEELGPGGGCTPGVVGGIVEGDMRGYRSSFTKKVETETGGVKKFTAEDPLRPGESYVFELDVPERWKTDDLQRDFLTQCTTYEINFTNCMYVTQTNFSLSSSVTDCLSSRSYS